MKLHILQIEYDTFDRGRGVQKPSNNPKTNFIIKLIYPNGNFGSIFYINKLFTDALEISLVARNFASTLDATSISGIGKPHLIKKLGVGSNYKIIAYMGKYLIKDGELISY